MTTIAPGQHTVKPASGKPRRRTHDARRVKAKKPILLPPSSELGLGLGLGLEENDAGDENQSLDEISASMGIDLHDDDPTEYPSSEIMSRDPVESRVAGKLEAVIARYQASRGIVCYTGSDNFVYWQKGDNKRSVSPDVYVLPGISPDSDPRRFEKSKYEGCWKTWVHGVAPSFAVEVKAFRNPRKDELQSPQRHDALGTKELIVFDPFYVKRRRKDRKRFVVYRRNEAGKLVPVLETHERRVRSEVLDAVLVAEGDEEKSLLRLGVGPAGETLLPFDSELIETTAGRADEEARRADGEARRAAEETRLRLELAQRVEEETRLRLELARRVEEEALRREEETQRAKDAIRRAAELEAELARLRANEGKRRK